MDKTRDARYINAQPEKKAKKRRHIGRWVSLGLTIAILFTPIALVYGLFYDAERANITRRENFHTDTFMKQKMIGSLDKTEETGHMSFMITSDDLNQMVVTGYDALKTTSPRIGEFLEGLSLETSDGRYDFVADIGIKSLFKTRIRLSTAIEETKIDDKDAVIFKVDNIKLGRVGGIQNGLKRALPGAINDDMVRKVIENIGFSLQSDMNNDRIYYFKESLYDDIARVVAPSEGIYEKMMMQFFKDKVFDITFAKEGVDGYIDLSHYQPNVNYLTPEKEQHFDFKDLNKKAASLIQNGILEPKDSANLIVFLVKGYDRVVDEFKELIKDKDLSSIGIGDVEHYEGVVAKQIISLYENIKDQITPEDIAAHKIGLITEEKLNETLQSSSMIGTSYIFDGYDENGNYKINTFIINNFYANILKDGIKFVIGISANGYDTHLCLKATFLDSDTDYTIRFAIAPEDIWYGEKSITDDFTDEVYAVFANAIKNDETISFDPVTKQFTIHYGKSVTDSGHAGEIDAIGTSSVELEGDSLSDDGVVNLIIQPY